MPDAVTIRKLDAVKDALMRADRSLGEAEVAIPERHPQAEALAALRGEIALILRNLHIQAGR